MNTGQNLTAHNEFSAASILGLSVHTLRSYRFHGRGPVYVKVGKSVRYMEADLRAFIDSHRVNPGAGA